MLSSWSYEEGGTCRAIDAEEPERAAEEPERAEPFLLTLGPGPSSRAAESCPLSGSARDDGGSTSPGGWQ